MQSALFFMKTYCYKIVSSQEWSSMESNSYENSHEIEMFFGHLVIDNWVFEIGNGQQAIGNK